MCQHLRAALRAAHERGRHPENSDALPFVVLSEAKDLLPLPGAGERKSGVA